MSLAAAAADTALIVASAHVLAAARGARGARVGGMSDTPGTSTDPELGSEGDTDQLPSEDTLLDRGVDDLLDEGYTVPDAAAHQPLRRDGVGGGAPRDDRPADRPGGARGLGGAGRAPEREEFRAGRLVEDDDAVEAGGTDGFAIDAGISGGAASAEEAAVHLIEEEYVDDRRYRDDVED